MTNRDALLDNQFLSDLHEYSQREIFAKILALDYEENPIEEIEGKVTQGSISLDGASAVRRTCSLTMVAEQVNINSYYWGLNTKVKIYIGLRNFINPNYPDIIWFQQGTYVITTFTTSQNAQGYTINLQGKDKMCLLNGDVGGNITALSVDFGTIDEIDEDGNITKKKYLLKDIIIEAVHEYAKEAYSNIIVNDLDTMGLELLEYRGLEPMYCLINQLTDEVEQITFDSNHTGYFIYTDGNYVESSLKLKNLLYDSRIGSPYGSTQTVPDVIYAKVNDEYIPYTVSKITAGETMGYRITDLTYAGDLIGSVGQTITASVLDPIVKQLGDFEYFYNLDGQFVFQRKKTYVNTSWNNIVKQEADYYPIQLNPSMYEPGKYYTRDGLYTQYILCTDEKYSEEKTYYRQVVNNEYEENSMLSSSCIYSFEDSNLITSFNNNPALNNVKNDFSIWGTRKGVSGASIPIHTRYAIDRKPTSYTNYSGRTFTIISKEEYVNNIQNEIQTTINNAVYGQVNNNIEYIKKTNPNNLPEDWWEVEDWANYYSIIMGDSPPGAVGSYANGGNGSFNVPSINLTQYFATPNSDDIKKDWMAASHSSDRPLYIFDIVYRHENDLTSAAIGYTGHNCGCSHEYSYFTNRSASGIGTSFIYKPSIPVVEIEEKMDDESIKKIEELQKKIDDVTMIIFDCEWREILYQMAIDKAKYGHNDNFSSTIKKNNLDLFPNGTTGYEQYFTDLYSFWRDLYDPDLDRLELYQYTKINFLNEIPFNNDFILTYLKKKNISDIVIKKADGSNEYESVIGNLYDSKVQYYFYYGQSGTATLAKDLDTLWLKYLHNEYFNGLKKNGLYKKENGKYIEVQQSEEYDSNFNYYTKGADIAETHPSAVYYQAKDDLSGYYKLKESQVVGTRAVDIKKSYYYTNGNEYVKYLPYGNINKSDFTDYATGQNITINKKWITLSEAREKDAQQQLNE